MEDGLLYPRGSVEHRAAIIERTRCRKFLESLCINSFAKFPIGSMKHAVMCDENGVIAAHGITERKAEDEFEFFAAPPWPLQKLAGTNWKVEARRHNDYLFQIAGPTSLKTLEKATGESLRDIRFLRFRESSIDGTKVEVARIGMSGNLAYELHGPIEDGPKIYDAVYRAGREFGIERLGWGTYLVNHVEGGFPQITWTFIPVPGMPDEKAREFIGQFFKISGSVDPADLRARYRTPVEVGWHRMCRLIMTSWPCRARGRSRASEANRGHAALESQRCDRHLCVVAASRRGIQDSGYAVRAERVAAGARQSHREGRPPGRHLVRHDYSYYFREVLSMGCVDVDASAIEPK